MIKKSYMLIKNDKRFGKKSFSVFNGVSRMFFNKFYWSIGLTARHFIIRVPRKFFLMKKKGFQNFKKYKSFLEKIS